MDILHGNMRGKDELYPMARLCLCGNIFGKQAAYFRRERFFPEVADSDVAVHSQVLYIVNVLDMFVCPVQQVVFVKERFAGRLAVIV
jgi:hypothetical protein